MKKKETGLSISKIEEISKIKNEPKWMLDFRLNSYKKFEELTNPIFGPDFNIDFEDINYYKKVSEKIAYNWNDVSFDLKETFDKIGLPDADKNNLAGTHLQVESEST